MSKHLRAQSKRDRIFDRLSIALDILSAWVYGQLSKTKTYIRETTGKQICIDVLAFLLLAFLALISPVMLVIGIMLW